MALKSTINTPDVREEVFAAASADDDICGHLGPDDTLEVAFEHGQWWVLTTCGASWSVVDAADGKGGEWFAFEQIDQGEEH